MANEVPRDPGVAPSGPGETLSQHPYVDRVRPDPSQPPERVRILEGLLGNSDREGHWRLYFTRELDNYAEFRQEAVVFSEPIPADQEPFLGQEATRVGIKRDATIEFTRTRTPRPVDEFDLDIRLGQLTPRSSTTATNPIYCTGFNCTDFCDYCPTPTDTCNTNCQPTCDTCRTRCGQPTCDTCRTRCDQLTCETCRTECRPCQTEGNTCTCAC
jgi:hypothetical protein